MPAQGLYDPFQRGVFPVGVRSFSAVDETRDREFPIEVWYPAAAQHTGDDFDRQRQDGFEVRGVQRRQLAVRDAAAHPGTYPLIVYSHAAGQHRRAATFLTTHLASHGYVVAALDHTETVEPRLGRQANETEEQKLARWDAVMASRVPDTEFLIGSVLRLWNTEARMGAERIGIAGHSFGGWTALAVPDVDPRIAAIVAHAPGGASNPRPGILPCKLEFQWGRDVPTLMLAAENDVSLPLSGMCEVFERVPATRQMLVLCRADHLHFMDDVEALHEGFRLMPLPPDLQEMQREMLPLAELTSPEKAQLFVRATTLAHFDAALKNIEAAKRFLAGEIEAALTERAIAVFPGDQARCSASR